jgi:hypothetical protein
MKNLYLKMILGPSSCLYIYNNTDYVIENKCKMINTISYIC